MWPSMPSMKRLGGMAAFYTFLCKNVGFQNFMAQIRLVTAKFINFAG